MTRKVFFYGFLLFLPTSLFAQQKVVGTVFDFMSKEPLEGVSVFYDGTSIGTVTNEIGIFSLATENPISSPLVISFIGYTSQLFENVSGGLGAIYLKENAVQLNEIVLEPDTWSREKKLNIFRREFLGSTIAGLNAKIKNEDAIRLYFNKNKNSLYAFAEVPIQIQNNYLGYAIPYTLRDFEVNFGGGGERLFSSGWTYTSGSLFFQEKNPKNIKKRFLKNRLETYLGSPLHFMRSLSKKRLQEEKFQIFKGSFQIDPYSEYQMEPQENFIKITQKTAKLSMLYDGQEQSFIEVKEPTFYIDSYGNFSPAQALFFGGILGKQRVADLLPLDYVPEKKN
mgnify:CR=1 FL=1